MGENYMFTSKNISRLIIVAILIVSTMHPDISGQTWTSLQGPPKARDVKDIAISKNGQILYACDKSVLFKSTNGGSSWSATTVELSSPLVVVCVPDKPETLVVGINGELRQNMLGGSGSWNQVLYLSGVTPLRLAVSPIAGQSNQMYMGRQFNGNYSLWYSGDGGATWKARYGFNFITSVYDIAPHPVSGTGRNYDVWAVGSSGAAEGTNQQSQAVSRGVWYSDNLGQTWSEKKMGDFNVRAIALFDIGTGKWPIVVVGTASGKVSRSIDGGDNWSKPKILANNVEIIRAIRFRSDVNQFFAATNNGVYLSADSGKTWTGPIGSSTMIDKNIQSFVIVPDNQNIMYATTNTTIYKTTDGGTTWMQAGNNFEFRK